MTHASAPKRSIWSLFALTVTFFVLILVVLELFARTAFVERISPYRSMGVVDYQFEIKWFRLQDYVKQNGGVDIIILGSSLVNTGLDADVVAQTYFARTGVHPRIFNFGVEGMTVAPNSVIAGLLVERYHPALLIYVTEMRDYIAGNGLEYETPFLSDPWLQNQLGHFTFSGWIIDHSAGLQRYLPYRNWMRSDFLDTMAIYLRRYQDTSASGYEPEHMVASNLDQPPSRTDPENIPLFNELSNYQTAPSRLKDLQTILDLKKNQGTSVWIVEMPVDPSYYVFVGGDEVHQQFQKTISTATVSGGGFFLPAETCNDIPIGGRANRWHLNNVGAPIFSKCLGKQLAIQAGKQKSNFVVAGAK